MPDNNFGASFQIDVTNLKAGLAQANRLIRESESEFKAAAAGMDDWTESQEGLEAKMKALNKTQDLQKKKVNALQSEYDRLIAQGIDPASAQMVKLRTDLNKEKEALAKTEKEMRNYTEALDELANGADEASDQVDDLADSARESGDGFTIMKGTIANLIGDGIGALVGATKNAIGSLAGLADETRETRTAIAKLNLAFQTAGHDTAGAYDDAQRTLVELQGVLGDTDRAVESASFLAKMSKDEKDLAANTRILTGVFAEYGDSIPTEGLAEGMAASAEMASVQGVLADALEWQGVNLDDYNAKLETLKTSEERAAYIQQTLTDIYGESADTYRENNAELIKANEAQLRQSQVLGELGAKMEPLTTAFSIGWSSILETITQLLSGVDVESWVGKINEGFKKFNEEIIPKLLEGLRWIKDNKDELIAGVAGIGAAFVAFKVVGIIQAVTGALQGMSLAQAALNLVMAMNPVGLLVAAIVGLIATIALLWKNSDKFREGVLNIFESIKRGFRSVVSGLSAGLDTIKSIFSGIGAWFGAKFQEAWQGIKNAFAGIGEFFGGIWTTIVSTFSTVGQKVADAIGGAFKSAINAVIGTVERAINNIPNSINAMLGVINKLPGVNIGNVPTVSLPRLAKGGVVDKATAAIIGEAGREAVVPLENNLEWLEIIADKISSKMGGQSGAVTINQTNNYSREHSRREIYQSKQEMTRAVKRALKEAKA